MKKPTMQMIADAVGVSRITVWKVLNNRPGVSQLLQNQILEAAVKMGYPALEAIAQSPASAPASRKSDSYTISVVVSRPDSSAFWMNIIHEIAKVASQKDCSVLYTYVPSEITENYELPPALTNGAVQGMIVLNIYDTRLLALLNSLPIPKVFLDCVSDFPIDSLTGDLVLLEGKHSIQQITDTLIRKGRRRIGFIGDIHYALTNQMRYEGYLSSMKSHGLPVEEKFCLTSPIGIQSYISKIHSFLDALDVLPDAFVCVSDFVASCVYQYLSAHNQSVPGDIALSGYDNTMEYLEISDWLTTVDVNTPAVGIRLFYQLGYRIENPAANFETIYLNPEIIYRKSTG